MTSGLCIALIFGVMILPLAGYVCGSALGDMFNHLTKD